MCKYPTIRSPLNTTVHANYITSIPNNVKQIEFHKSDESSSFDICDSNSSIVTNYHRSDNRCWDIDGTRYHRVCADSCDCKTIAFQNNKQLCKKYDIKTSKHKDSSGTLFQESSQENNFHASDMNQRYKKVKPCDKYSNKYINTACLCDSVTLIKKKVIKTDKPKNNLQNVSFNERNVPNRNSAKRKKLP